VSIGEPNIDEDRAEQHKTKAEAVQYVIETFEKKLKDGGVKLTAAEYLRMVELREQNETREIKITWVEPAKTESSNEE
jgi:hypothetical protein